MTDFRSYSELYHSELYHYASPYYDPDKAHAYYMKHRKLKGRNKKVSDKPVRKSLSEWWNGGDSRSKEEASRHKAQDARAGYANEVGFKEGKDYTRGTGTNLVFTNDDSKKHERMNNRIEYDNKRGYNRGSKIFESLNKLESDYRKDSAKAKIAKNDSVVGKAKRNMNVLKDVLSSINLDDYKNFYGNFFKKKPKK